MAFVLVGLVSAAVLGAMDKSRGNNDATGAFAHRDACSSSSSSSRQQSHWQLAQPCSCAECASHMAGAHPAPLTRREHRRLRRAAKREFKEHRRAERRVWKAARRAGVPVPAKVASPEVDEPPAYEQVVGSGRR
ncbi:uncharacterized protein JN550_003953 [Neoarthrinium moseri]|uniref:uncharacterized protein n=1 Tax=Neoarthrinium moseri TaxID=1658444 RepID=UPI001FDB2144|nr:uncharacterized protein JN550_003953 [Neoarthrinium moseri]KAI1872234.1 hypothetical protein JN550_003953 [Neoarthrinium moseri]